MAWYWIVAIVVGGVLYVPSFIYGMTYALAYRIYDGYDVYTSFVITPFAGVCGPGFVLNDLWHGHFMNFSER